MARFSNSSLQEASALDGKISTVAARAGEVARTAHASTRARASDGVLFMSSPGSLGFLVCNGDASGGAAWKRRRAVQRRERRRGKLCQFFPHASDV